MKVVAYARVSTVEKGQNPEVQLKELREYIAHRRWQCVGEFVDKVSGVKVKRPQLDQLLKDMRRGKFNGVVVVRLDRLGRSLKHLVTLINELQERNVALISIKEGIDFSTCTGRLMFHIVASLAEFERDLIRERVKAGLQYARSKGVKIGRRPVYMDNARIQSLRDKGWSIREIAKMIRCPPTSVWKSLQTLSAN